MTVRLLFERLRTKIELDLVYFVSKNMKVTGQRTCETLANMVLSRTDECLQLPPKICAFATIFNTMVAFKSLPFSFIVSYTMQNLKKDLANSLYLGWAFAFIF